MTADTEKEQNAAPKSTHCLICNSRVGVSTRNSLEIFHKTVVTTSERPLSYTIGAVLGQEMSEDSVHSNVICKKCFKLINEVDEIETRLAELKLELKTNYQRTLKIQSDGGKQSPAPDDDDRKLPLGSDDGNVRKNILQGSRKKMVSKKVKPSPSQNSEEDYEQKVCNRKCKDASLTVFKTLYFDILRYENNAFKILV